LLANDKIFLYYKLLKRIVQNHENV
jgi:hypothetical protein